MENAYITPMLSTPPKGGRLFVEPLEQRIAPTNLVALANHPQDAGAPNYLTYSTPPAAGKLGFVPAGNYGIPNAGNLFAIALSGDGSTSVAPDGTLTSNGDQIQIFSQTDGFRTFLQIPKGQLVAFFQDGNGDNEVQTNELVGLSLGKKSQVSVSGNVNGDIVTNLGTNGLVMLNSVGGPKQRIDSLKVVGNVFGNIVSGGDVSGVAISGNVNAIFAGTAANAVVYDFGGQGLITSDLTAPAPAVKSIGASITNLSVLSITDRIQAGDGGLLGKGGSVSGVTLQGDGDGFKIFSGNGGAGAADSFGVKGGPGGAISEVLIKGVTDTSANSPILIQSGHGGTNSAFKGGNGGSISGIGTSLDFFDSLTNANRLSGSLLNDNIVIRGGDGGDGLKGGKGGSVANSALFGAIADDQVTAADGAANPEIQVFGGNGGMNFGVGPGAKGGKGGGISGVTAENLSTLNSAINSSILLQAGAGGAVNGGGKGQYGGSIDTVALLGTKLIATAGAGSDGVSSGGAGGSVTDLAVLNLQNLFANEITLNAGAGGAGAQGSGGAGGAITNLQVNDSDLAALTINSGTHANGGVGGAGVGGAGGAVINTLVNDSGVFRPVPATVAIRSGAGGDGLLGGAKGGDVDTLQILGSDFASNVAAGNGGNVSPGGIGKGGSGGDLFTVGISNQPFDTANTNFAAGATATATAGNGGVGYSKGGAGGQLNLVNFRSAFDVTLAAGAGGSGGVARAGSGGSVLGSAGSSLFGAVSVRAGDAGAQGAAAGTGGGIDGFIAAASTNIAMTGGAGGAGGAGGSITNSGNATNQQTGSAPTGNVTVVAGAGSAANGFAGAGGAITVFNGRIGLSGTTSFTAGAGGGGDGATASGAGGSIDQVKLNGDAAIGIVPVQVSFDAGNAGVATAAKRGAAGGSVTNVTVFNLDTSSLVHHVAAGDGANALKHGGKGGSISEVHVGIGGEAVGDIGVRSGAAFGYAAGNAGGLFAGVGGSGSKNFGAPGDVMNVTANAIASIAAGKTTTPQLAGTVDNIFLNGLVVAAADSNQAFLNFDVANIVGSVQGPTTPGASIYKTGDGLIAALNVTQNRNFRAEAILTVDEAGNRQLADLQEPNTNLVIFPA